MESRENDIVLSFSRLSSYKGCPYRCKNATRSDSAEATAATLGKACHESLAIFFRRGYAAARAEAIRIAPATGLDSTMTADLLNMIDRICRSPYYQFSEDRILAVESDDGEIFEHGRQMFLVELPINIGGRKVFIRGAFDLVVKQKDDGIEIIDWKSGFKKADKFQGELYALIAFLKYWRVSPIRVRFVYTRSGFSEYEDYDSTDMSAILQYVAILANAYANETAWEPRFNANCKDCEFRTACSPYLDAMSRLPETPQIDPENWEAIQKWENHIAAISSCAKRLGDELDTMKREYLKKHGETKALDGRVAYIGERINRYGIPWSSIRANLDGVVDAQELIEYVSPSQVEEFLTKKVVEGVITPEKSAELMGVFEKQKQPTSKSDTIKFKGEKPKKSKAK